jgi:hypothetical protein
MPRDVSRGIFFWSAAAAVNPGAVATGSIGSALSLFLCASVKSRCLCGEVFPGEVFTTETPRFHRDTEKEPT